MAVGKFVLGCSVVGDSDALMLSVGMGVGSVVGRFVGPTVGNSVVGAKVSVIVGATVGAVVFTFSIVGASVGFAWIVGIKVFTIAGDGAVVFGTTVESLSSWTKSNSV